MRTIIEEYGGVIVSTILVSGIIKIFVITLEQAIQGGL